MTCRTLQLPLILVAAAVFPILSAAQDHSHAETAANIVPVSRAPGPAVLVNESRAPHTVEVTITAEPAKLSLLPGKTTVGYASVSYTHLRAHETPEHLVCRLLLEKKK